MADDIAEKGITRGEFIRKVATAIFGSTILGGATATILPKSKDQSSTTAQKAKEPPQPITRPELAPPSRKQLLDGLIFRNFSNEEISKTYGKITDPELLKSDEMRILDKQRNHLNSFVATASYIEDKYSAMVDQAIQTITAKTRFKNIHPAWKDILQGIIYIESKGHPHPSRDDETPKEAERGLCQLRIDARQKAEEILGWKNADFWDPLQNITMTLTYLMWLEELFQDPSLAVEAYNDGPMNVIYSIRRAANDKEHDAAYLVKQSNLNIMKLPDINIRHYAFRVLAASHSMLDANQTKA